MDILEVRGKLNQGETVFDLPLRVAYYARVSTGKDSQLHSLDAQEKYYDEFIKKDLYFFLGTTLAHHNVSKNPFLIIGIFYPPIQSLNQQMNLFDL